MWDTREKEAATMTLQVLSLLCRRDARRLNWNILEEEVILGSGEPLMYKFVEMVGHPGRDV